jgi:hypothetical protein
MKSSYDIIIWIFIFLLIALIIGLYISENKRIPSSLYIRTNGSSTPYIEHFEQKNSNIDGYRNSSSFDVSGGASSKYGWGINEYDNDYERNQFEKDEGQDVKKCISKKNDPMCTKDYIEEKNKESCYKCDILEHPDIDKASEAEGKIIAYFKRNVEPSALNKYCFENNLILNHLVLKKLSLEEQFLALTQ